MEHQAQDPPSGPVQLPISVQAGDEGVESSPAKKDLGLLVDENLDVIWQCALTAQKASRILGCIKSSMGCIKSSMGCRSREGILPLRSGESPPGVLRPALGSPVK